MDNCGFSTLHGWFILAGNWTDKNIKSSELTLKDVARMITLQGPRKGYITFTILWTMNDYWWWGVKKMRPARTSPWLFIFIEVNTWAHSRQVQVSNAGGQRAYPQKKWKLGQRQKKKPRVTAKKPTDGSTFARKCNLAPMPGRRTRSSPWWHPHTWSYHFVETCPSTQAYSRAPVGCWGLDVGVATGVEQTLIACLARVESFLRVRYW